MQMTCVHWQVHLACPIVQGVAKCNACAMYNWVTLTRFPKPVCTHALHA